MRGPEAGTQNVQGLYLHHLGVFVLFLLWDCGAQRSENFPHPGFVYEEGSTTIGQLV